MDAIECLKTRRSIRKYQNKPVPKEVIEDIVDCGRLAATAMNTQPWEFVVVQDEQMRKAIADITDYGKFIPEAPVCIAVFCHDYSHFLEDGSAATQNLLNAARAHELGSCWIAGHGKPYAKKIGEMLGVPEDCRLIALVTVGYPAAESNPPKKPLTEVIHWERYGHK